MSAATLDSAPPQVGQVTTRRRPSRRALLVLGVAVVIATLGVVWLRAPKASVTTENAYLKTDRTEVAPRVKGQIAQVLVVDNQQVVAGQPLIRLDPSEYAARLASAQGDLALARAQVASAQAALSRLGAEQHLAAASTRQAETDIRAADAQSDRAQADWTRFQALVGDGTVARRDAERVHADALSASATAAKTRAALDVSRDQATVTDHRRGELMAAIDAARAAEAKAQAAVDLARQDADHAVIRAPIAGVVGDRQANPGDFVQPGARLMTLIPMETLHVTANFKETQTDRMLQGQAAIVRVDALPGVKLKAHVQSFAPGSGSEFALLPFEPGTGNFTKIVQRVPVRLTFDPGQADVAKLRSGLSAKVTVRLRD
ncbi:HlyD family secretion protein [Phenylobacterium aquaticum]|uniref:HlyD family secretion protein n=1 Tax=Phenylobacterium aquaticum TaxID=1763816 RepID=UPI0026ED49D7|nr:HlyD family secretion protein [Phenylobacterium aquaticum]